MGKKMKNRTIQFVLVIRISKLIQIYKENYQNDNILFNKNENIYKSKAYAIIRSNKPTLTNSKKYTFSPTPCIIAPFLPAEYT